MSDISFSTGARVRAAVEALYREFAAPAPPVIEGCPCCIAERGVDVLLTTPLRQLSGQQLWAYVSGLFYTVGSVGDFRYLLPRILDVAVNDPGNSNDPEIVLGKIGLADWQGWAAPERRAVQELIDAWFEMALVRDALNSDEGFVGTEAESVLCGAARAGLSLKPWLDRLREPDARPVLADLAERYPDQLSAFWEDAPAGLESLSEIISQQ